MKTTTTTTTTIILLYYYTIILLYYYTIILLYYYTIILLYYYTIILLYYYTIILLYYYTIILLYYYTNILLYYYTIILLYYYTTPGSFFDSLSGLSERAVWGVGGGYAARLLLLFSFPCSADHEQDWPSCNVVFPGWQPIRWMRETTTTTTCPTLGIAVAQAYVKIQYKYARW